MSKARTNLVILAGCVILCRLWTVAEAGAAEPVELQRYKNDVSYVRVEPARMGDKEGLAVIFEGSEELHYYAKKETAAGGYNLTLKVHPPKGVRFGDAVFDQWDYFLDSTQNKKVEVYAGDFTVFLPIELNVLSYPFDVKVDISGIACTSTICLRPFTKTLTAHIDYEKAGLWQEISFKPAGAVDNSGDVRQASQFSVPVAFLVALLAGLVLNVMPCVWPVIPIIVGRIFSQAGSSRAKSMGLALGFCAGIILFFAAIAVFNIILRLGYGVVFQWGDHFRNPAFVTGMVLLMVVLGLYMFGLFSIGIPASITGKAGTSSGYAGSVGMGFLAALLATPCSFAILAAAVAWAQTQPLWIATISFLIIGVGMAAPYAVLILVPGLVSRLPRPGGWMEKIKQGMGFLLFVIAIKLFGAIPSRLQLNVLYYALILSFCVWMWGGWVTLSTTAVRKWLVRIIVAAIAVAAGFSLLGVKDVKSIDWLDYDARKITQAVEANQPVLIKFTAKWCATCSVVEKFVYQRKDIIELIERKAVITFKGDTTVSDSAATVDLAKLYKEPGIPVTVLYLPGGKRTTLRGLIGREDLKEVLDKLPDAKH